MESQWDHTDLCLWDGAVLRYAQRTYTFVIGAHCALPRRHVEHFGPSASEIWGTPRTTHFWAFHSSYFIHMNKSLVSERKKNKDDHSEKPGFSLFTNCVERALQIPTYYSPIFLFYNAPWAFECLTKPLHIHRTFWQWAIFKLKNDKSHWKQHRCVLLPRFT